jgi:hypothetical protein
MWITTYFNTNIAPVTGLTPMIKIREVETGTIVVSGTMSEVGDGFYTYDFAGYDITKDYYMFCDALTLPSKYRYKYLTSGEYGDIINTVGVLSDNVELRTLLIKKILTNRLELVDGDTNNWVLYDDDSATTLLTWDVTDKSDSAVEQEEGTESRRSKAT